MASNTPNMGLTRWDLTTDPYNHAQLVSNWNLLDNHDHSNGKGVQVGTAGIQAQAVTQPLIAPNAVGNQQIIDRSVTLHKADLLLQTPLRAILPWWRENKTVQVPDLYHVCDGTPWRQIPNDMGLTVGAIPDLRSRFLVGAYDDDDDGPGFLSWLWDRDAFPPEICGEFGGEHWINMSHAHSDSGHFHTITPHTHTCAPHSHPITPGGSHVHEWQKDDQVTYGPAYTTGLATATGTQQVLYVPGFTGLHTGGQALMGGPISAQGFSSPDLYPDGNHDHGGQVGSTGLSLSSVALTTDHGDAGFSFELDFDKDIRPRHMHVLWIMKVKQS